MAGGREGRRGGQQLDRHHLHARRHVMQPRNLATMQPRNPAAMQPRNPETLQPCNNATLQRCTHAKHAKTYEQENNIAPTLRLMSTFYTQRMQDRQLISKTGELKYIAL